MNAKLHKELAITIALVIIPSVPITANARMVTQKAQVEIAMVTSY